MSKGYQFSPEDYTPERLRSGAIPEKDILREYARVQRLVTRRFRTMEKQGLTKGYIYSKYGMGFPTLSEIRDKRGNAADIVYGLTDMYKILTHRRGTARGELAARKSELRTLDSHGYDFVNLDNYDKWREYMKAVTDTGSKKIFGSNRVAEEYTTLEAIVDDPAQYVMHHKQQFMNYLKTGKLGRVRRGKG